MTTRILIRYNASFALLAILTLTGTICAIAQVRDASTINLKRISADTAAMRKVFVGGTLGTVSGADSELTVQHGGHVKGGLKVDGVISGTVAPLNPFVWSVTGSSTVQDSLRFIPGPAIVQTRSVNTVTTGLDSNAAAKLAGLTIKARASSSALTITANDVNINTSTTAQAADTSSVNVSFTNTGKPLLTMTGPTGNVVAAVDSLGRFGLGVSPGNMIHTQWVGGSVVWANDAYGDNGPIPIFAGRQFGGTPVAPTATLSGNTIARFSGVGHTGTAVSGSRGILDIAAAENWSSSGNGTVLKFWTTKIGSTTVTERMRIDDQGNVGVGSTNPRVGLDIAKGFAIRDSTGAQLTGNVNDYSIGGVCALRLSSDATRTITGIAGGLQGRFLYLINVGSSNVIISNQNGSSSAANRIITGTGSDFTIGADQIVTLWYDATTNRWRKI